MERLPGNVGALSSTNPLLSDRTRLALIVALASSERPVSFMELAKALELTKGNLSTHLRRLEDAGLVSCAKTFEGRKPLSLYSCTEKGREETDRYLAVMEQLIRVRGLNPRKRR